MSRNCARQTLKIAIAQIVQSFGFQSTQTIALDVLNEILERYILLLCKSSRDFAEIASRTEPIIEDVALSFDRYRINLADLDEFVTCVDMPKYAHDVVKFPNRKENKLGFVNDPDNEELKARIEDEDQEHVYYFHPLMVRTKDQEAHVVMPIPVELNNIENNVNRNDGGEDVQMLNEDEEHTTSSTVSKNGIQYDKNMWHSQYDPVHRLNRSLSNMDIAVQRHKEPVSAQPKFPSFYHKPKPPKVLVKPQTMKPEREGSGDTEAKIISSIDNTATPLVDQMMEAVMTKYTTPQITVRRSSSPKLAELRQFIDETQKQQPRTSTGASGLAISPYRGSDDDESRVISPGPSAPLPPPSQQQQPLTLKISRSSLEHVSPAKKPRETKKKQKDLKIIINKKFVLNPTDLTTPSQLDTVESSGNLSRLNTNAAEQVPIVVYDSDDANFVESEEKPTIVPLKNDSNEDVSVIVSNPEPLLWKPTCDPLEIEDLFNPPTSIIPDVDQTLLNEVVSQQQQQQQQQNTVQSASNPDDVQILGSTDNNVDDKMELLVQSKVETVEDDDDVEIVLDDGTNNNNNDNDEKKHHKKKKKEKHKKHKKEKHNKHNREHKSQQENVEQVVDLTLVQEEVKDEIPEIKQEEAMAEMIPEHLSRPVPKLKLKLGIIQ